MTAKRVAKAAAKKAAAPVAKSYNPFVVAQEQFDRIADLLDLDQATRDLLRNPLRDTVEALHPNYLPGEDTGGCPLLKNQVSFIYSRTVSPLQCRGAL